MLDAWRHRAGVGAQALLEGIQREVDAAVAVAGGGRLQARRHHASDLGGQVLGGEIHVATVGGPAIASSSPTYGW